MENAKQTIQEVKDNISQRSASRKDEITVMKAMMNDPSFSVDIYDKGGKIGEYYPGKEIRHMATNIVASTTKISNKEAAELVNNYEFTKGDAAAMVGIAKEFVSTYLQTGRKLPLGGRATSNIELVWKDIEERKTRIPGGKGEGTLVPAHGGIRALNPCPKWVKESK